jgi:hypothetical protein
MAGMSQQTKEPKAPCLQQQKLMVEVQDHLIKISELTRAVAEALANGNENLAAELDKQVDLELGMKERGMGALHQHRKEHGC